MARQSPGSQWGGVTIGSGGGGSSSLTQLAQKLEGDYASARAANLQRYKEATGIYDEIVSMYEPGGGFGAGYEAQLEQTKVKDVGSSIQQNISSGLYGVQTTGGAANRWEAEVGQPARLRLEDLRRERYTGALEKKAGVIERREDEYPDQGLIASLYAQASQQPGPMSFSIGDSGSSFEKDMFPLFGRSGSSGVYTSPYGTSASTQRVEPSTQPTSSATSVPSTPSYVGNIRTGGGLSTPTTSQSKTIQSRLAKMYPNVYGANAPSKSSGASHLPTGYGQFF